jgi:hypothetical protein
VDELAAGGVGQGPVGKSDQVSNVQNVNSILRKLGVVNRAEIAAYAARRLGERRDSV